MHPSPHPDPVPVRVFTFFVDGAPITKSFPHGSATMAGKKDWRLNLLFHEWLEAELPGYFSAHRITHISFVDEMDPDSPYGPPGTKKDDTAPDVLQLLPAPAATPRLWTGGTPALAAAS